MLRHIINWQFIIIVILHQLRQVRYNERYDKHLNNTVSELENDKQCLHIILSIIILRVLQSL